MESDLVIVRGINSDYFQDNFIDMVVYFGGAAVGVPAQDAKYIGFYVEAPYSAITHIGIVDKIENTKDGGKNFYLKGIIKLDKPVPTSDGHAIRKHEYWTLKDLGINRLALIFNKLVVFGK
jgi:hypothetical protein